MVISGSTILFSATFYDDAGAVVKPDNVRCIIYSGLAKKLDELLVTQTEEGGYTAEYIVPANGAYFFEFAGMIEGKPYINRQKFVARFSEN